jgi:regulatory protein
VPRPRAGATDPHQVALRLIGLRAHSEAELRRKLAARGFAEEAVEAAVRRLRGQGYLDDDAYARNLVARRSGDRGAALIAAELAARGIDRHLAAGALGDLDRRQQLEAARRLVRRSPGLDPQRLAARMQRRGFAHDVIRDAIPDLYG